MADVWFVIKPRHIPMIRQTNVGIKTLWIIKFNPLLSPPHPLKEHSSSCHRPLTIGTRVSQYHSRPRAGSRGKRPDMKESFVGQKLTSFCAVWLNHNGAGNKSRLSLFHYSVQSCYQALNIVSLYIPFLPARLKKEKKKRSYLNVRCIFHCTVHTRLGPLSFLFLLPLTPFPWVIANTHVYQLQMKEAFATGSGNRWGNQGEALCEVQLFWWLVAGNVSQWHSFSPSSALWRLTCWKLKYHPHRLDIFEIRKLYQPTWCVIYFRNFP